MGGGWSSPVIAGGRVWLTAVNATRTARGEDSDVSLRLIGLDVASGREVVNTEVFRIRSPGAINIKNSRASPTPIVDGDRVYVHFGADGTAALTTSGQMLWSTRLRYDAQHGNGGSPVLYRDLLIINCDGWGDDAYVVALDTQTGKSRWRTSRRRPWSHAYSTPLVIRVGDEDQVVSVGAYRTVAYEPLTGKEIWRVSYGEGFSNVPRPVFGQGLVFIATGFQEPALMAVRADGRGDVTRNARRVDVDARRAVYAVAAARRRRAVLRERHRRAVVRRCEDADRCSGSSARWQLLRVAGLCRRPHLRAQRRGSDDRVYSGQDVSAAGNNRLDGTTLASMAIADRSLFIRTDTHLYRIALP